MLSILNDVHVGAVRSSGTTPFTQLALRKHILSELGRLLDQVDTDLMVLGDLFDTANIPLSDLSATLSLFSGWLTRNPDKVCYQVAGNHDLSKTSSVMSSFDFLNSVLSNYSNYVVIKQPMMTPHGYVIPHCLNQDVFDIEISKVPECSVLYLHCNVDNHFAAQSDQSLNISLEQVNSVPAKYIVCAHEHHYRKLGKVLLPGNQVASSVSDWLSNHDKYLAGVENGLPITVKVADRAAQFTELDWRTLEETDHKFIRVVGDATQEEAHEVVNALAAFRRRSEALVITNAVQVLSAEGLSESFEATLEAAKGFDVIKCLLSTLDAEEREIVEKLL